MAQKPDGTVYIDTLLDTTGMSAGSKEVEASVRRMADKVAGLGEKAEIATRKAVNAFAKQNQAYAEQERKIDSLNQKYDEMSKQKVETEEYAAAVREVDKLDKALLKAYDRKEKFLETGGNEASRTFRGIEVEIQRLEDRLRQATYDKEALESSGKAYQTVDTSDMEEKLLREKEKLQQMNYALGTSYQALEARVRGYYDASSESLNSLYETGEKADALSTRLKRAESSMRSFHKSTRNSNKSLGSGIKTMLKYSLGIRSLFVLFNKVRGAISEGFKNLAQYSSTTNGNLSSMKSSLTQLKNSLATAFSPILTIITPILSGFIDLLSRVATYIGMFIAALSGANTFERAIKVQEDYAASLGQTADAAKDADKYLSGLDEIRTYGTDKGSSGAAGSVSPAEMFETVPIENKLKDFAAKVKKTLSDMVSGLADSWNEYGSSILQTLNNIRSNVKDFAMQILSSTVDWAKALNWDPLLSSIDVLLIKLEPLISIISEGLAWAYKNVLLPFGKWTIEKGLTLLIQSLGNAFDFITTVLDRLKPIFTWFWQNLLLPFGESIGQIAEGILTSFNGILTFLTGVFTGDWDMAFEGMKTAAEGLSGVVFVVFDFIERVLDNFDGLLQGAFKKDWTRSFGEFGKVLNSFFDLVEAIWNLIKGVFKGINTFLHGAFTGDWKAAWEGVQQILKVIWDGIQNIVKAAIGIVQNTVNLGWQAIKTVTSTVWSGIKSSLSSAWDWAKTQASSVFNGIKTNIESAWSSLKSSTSSTWSTIKSSLSSQWSSLKSSAQSVASSIKSTFVSSFEGILSKAKSIFDSVKSVLSSMWDKVKSTASSVSSKLSSITIFSTLPDYSSPVIPVPSVPTPNIPYLATGAVIPPNAPFMAMLGDQRNGKNLELPESLLRKVVREEAGNNGFNGTIRIPINLNGRQLFEAIITEAQLRQMLNGNNPFELA